MNCTLDAGDFLDDQTDRIYLDVRSPSEFSTAHIPGALSFPLFTDEERATVGTLYKQQGPQEAMLRGLEFVGPKMADFVREANRLNPDKKVFRMYCFRGGQRSQSLAWLLQKGGFEVELLNGGYKAYRKHVLESFHQPQDFLVLSGCTGSAKTRLLHALRDRGEQIIDIEGLACHRGSAFGGYHQPADLTTEMFENRLHQVWQRTERTRRVWVEDEGRTLGKIFIPDGFWSQMRAAPVVFLDVAQEHRVKFLVQEYSHYDDSLLADSVDRIQRRLGSELHKKCRSALVEGNYTEVVRYALDYYDKAYLYCLNKREAKPLFNLSLEGVDIDSNVERLLEFANELVPEEFPMADTNLLK
jgi:tRNA 2-selenouridine synthase